MFAFFTAIPLVGHLNQLLRQAEELQRRGWRVAVASTREMAEHSSRESPRVPFVDLRALGAIADRLKADQLRASNDPNLPLGTLGTQASRSLWSRRSHAM